jgi:hypothetical protein
MKVSAADFGEETVTMEFLCAINQPVGKDPRTGEFKFIHFEKGLNRVPRSLVDTLPKRVAWLYDPKRKPANDLAAQHAELVPKCREARDRSDRLKKELNDAQYRAINAGNAVIDAEQRYKNVLLAKPRPESYPTADEMRAWENAVATALTEVNTRRQAVRDAVDLRNSLNRERLDASNELAQLAWQEQRLRDQLPAA